MRRLPIYLLIDVSGSMQGESIEAVRNGVNALVTLLHQDPYTLEWAALSIIIYDREVKIVLPLTALEYVLIPDIVAMESNQANMGAALKILCEQVDKEVYLSTPERKGDFKPSLFLMSDGKISDVMDYNEAVDMVRHKKFAQIVAFAAGSKAKVETLKKITDQIYTLDMDTFKQLFRWERFRMFL